MKNYTNLLIFLGIISFVFLGCSKKDESSSSSTANTEVAAVSGSSSITLSAKVSVVEPKTTDSTARTANAIDTTGFAATSEYTMDDSATFVYEESAEPLGTVNEILCKIGQSRPDLMLNAGNYKAQIDNNKCSTNTGDSQSNAPDYDMWIANSTRTEGQPMEVKVFVPVDSGFINAKMSVFQPPSTDYPMGLLQNEF